LFVHVSAPLPPPKCSHCRNYPFVCTCSEPTRLIEQLKAENVVEPERPAKIPHQERKKGIDTVRLNMS